MSEAGTQAAATSKYNNTQPPFNDDEADVIVRSADEIDFHVHKAILSLASPFFKAMFSLPQAGDSDTAEGAKSERSGIFSEGRTKNGLPLVEADEDGETLGVLLRLCYPSHMQLDCEHPFPTVERVLAVLTAAHKYEMDGVERQTRDALVSARFLSPSNPDSAIDPFRLFTLAAKHRLPTETLTCARHTLHTPFLGRTYIPELEEISAGTYHRLQTYHTSCGAASNIAQLQNLRWIPTTQENMVWFECSACRGSAPVVLSGERRKWPTRWWAEFMGEAAGALRDRPAGKTVTVESEIAGVALEKASACTTCRTRVFREMREFCALFAAEVERETALVKLELSWEV